jgi:hypothetical protein
VATRVGQPLILTDCVANNTTVALWELRPTGGGPALLDFQLALWLFNDWCIAANVADDIVPNGLGLAGCDANDARQCGTSGSASSAWLQLAGHGLATGRASPWALQAPLLPPGAPASSPRPSTYCSSARHNGMKRLNSR